eukprot:scaffold4856_cov29-Tisochrysis_lutea.AAC.6
MASNQVGLARGTMGRVASRTRDAEQSVERTRVIQGISRWFGKRNPQALALHPHRRPVAIDIEGGRTSPQAPAVAWPRAYGGADDGA